MIITRIGKEKELSTEIDRIDLTINGVSYVIRETNEGKMKVTSYGGGTISIFPCVANEIEVKAEEW